MQTKQDIAERIRDRREDLDRRYGGYTQGDVAQKLGMSRVGYNHYETGKNDITAPVLSRIAEILRVPVSTLLGELTDEQFEDAEAARYYRGIAPPLRDAAREMLRVLYEQTDREDSAA